MNRNETQSGARSSSAWALGLCVFLVGCGTSAEATPERPTAAGASAARGTAATKAPAGAKRDFESEPPPAPPKEPVAAEAAAPRVYVKTRYVWIRGLPDSSVQWIGYLWHGGSVRLRSDKPIVGPGCSTWYAIEPRGYVCVDGKRATLDADDAEFGRIRKYSPDTSKPSPHRYAESLGVVRYKALPEAAEQRLREPDLEEHLRRIEAARHGEVHESLVGVDLSPSGQAPFGFESLPNDLRTHRDVLKRRSTVAYSAEVDHTGRTFLLGADFAWMPKDRVVPYPEVTFHGVHLEGATKLPLAFFRKRDRPQYRRDASGAFAPAASTFPRLGFVGLTGRSETAGETVFLETAVPGVYIDEKDAVVPKAQEHTPWGAVVGQPDTTTHQPSGRQTWVQTSVLGGWLIAYEGTRPVFTTLIAAGRGGTPVPDKDPVETASTPVGRFNITGKFITATMEAPHEFIHSDVPWTQNFSGPHALHAAYWHDGWGELKSGGCINVSPQDGKWLFGFTEPQVPQDWHAVRWNPKSEPSTTLIVHR